jgi:hypothetical protein
MEQKNANFSKYRALKNIVVKTVLCFLLSAVQTWFLVHAFTNPNTQPEFCPTSLGYTTGWLPSTNQDHKAGSFLAPEDVQWHKICYENLNTADIAEQTDVHKDSNNLFPEPVWQSKFLKTDVQAGDWIYPGLLQNNSILMDKIPTSFRLYTLALPAKQLDTNLLWNRKTHVDILAFVPTETQGDVLTTVLDNAIVEKATLDTETQEWHLSFFVQEHQFKILTVLENNAPFKVVIRNPKDTASWNHTSIDQKALESYLHKIQSAKQK